MVASCAATGAPNDEQAWSGALALSRWVGSQARGQEERAGGGRAEGEGVANFNLTGQEKFAGGSSNVAQPGKFK